MNSTKVSSILLLLIGSVLFGIGLVIYWFTTATGSGSGVPTSTSPWASVLVLIGLLIMLASIIFLCIGIHYELEASIEQIGAARAIQPTPVTFTTATTTTAPTPPILTSTAPGSPQ